MKKSYEKNYREKMAGKPTVIAEYSDYLAWEEEIERLMEEGMSEDEAQEHAHNHPYYGEDYWDCALSDIWDNFVSPMIDNAKFTDEILIEGRSIGWRNLSGFKVIDTPKNAREFLEAFVPPNTPFSVKLEYYKKDNVIEARVSHHDSPTGEFYTISLIEEPIIEELKHKGISKNKIREFVQYHDEYSYFIYIKGAVEKEYIAWIERGDDGYVDVDLEEV